MSFKNKTKIIKTTIQSVGNNQRELMRTLIKNKGICLIMEKNNRSGQMEIDFSFGFELAKKVVLVPETN